MRSSARSLIATAAADDGWEVLRQAGFDSVRQVAIDDDWSALRFRRFEFLKQSKQ